MPLTTNEQLILATEPNDTWSFPGDFSLREFMYQKITDWYTDFQVTYKTGAEDTEYYRKISQTIYQVVARREYVASIVSVLISELADTSFTFAQITGATTDQWDAFIDDEIDKVVFIAARVTKADIAEYNALP